MKFIKNAAYSLFVLNFLDAIFTLLDLHTGIGTEANPIMAKCIEISPLFFIVVKLLFGGLVLLIFLHPKFRAGSPKIKLALFIINVVYLAVVLNNGLILLYFYFVHKYV